MCLRGGRLVALSTRLNHKHAEMRVFGVQGFQGYGLSIVRIRYLVPRMFVCVVFSCLAALRIEECLDIL